MFISLIILMQYLTTVFLVRPRPAIVLGVALERPGDAAEDLTQTMKILRHFTTRFRIQHKQ